MPTQEEIRSANYGVDGGGIDKFVAKKLSEISIKVFLKDPDSAKFKFSDQLYKGFIVERTSESLLGHTYNIEFGWLLDTYVNAKNSYGAYTGYKLRRTLYRNGEIVGMCKNDFCKTFPSKN